MRIMYILGLALTLSSCGKAIEDSAVQSSVRPGAEPKIACAYRSGEWCFLKNEYLQPSSSHADSEVRIYFVAQDFWMAEKGVIIESKGCGKSVANRMNLKETKAEFFWNDRYWRLVEIGFEGSPRCTLKLLAPPKHAAPLDMAASILSTNIATCDERGTCEPRLHSELLMRAFTRLE